MFTRTSSVALTALLLAASAAAGDPGVTLSHCHLPAWQPNNLPAGARFGTAVALDGHHAAVGVQAPDAVVTYQQIDGLWTQTQPIGSPVGPHDNFGEILTMHGGRLFVSAIYDDVLAANSGAVHIYEHIDGAWTLMQTLRDDTPTVNGVFGRALSADGEWLAVGAPGDEPSGAIHVFAQVDGLYERVDVITNGFVDDLGEELTIRARPGEDTVDLFTGDAGSHLIAVNGGIVWPYVVSHDQTLQYGPLVPSGLDEYDYFGRGLAFDGEQLFVGASGDDDIDNNSGTVYVFNVDLEPDLPTITERHKLVPPNPDEHERYGRHVQRSGDHLIVTGRLKEEIGEPSYVDVLRKDVFGDGWHLEDRLVSSDWQFGDDFVSAVSFDAGRVLIGASNKDGANANDGAAYMFSTLSKNPLSGHAPSPYLAQSEMYGEGKPGSMGVPVLASNQLAVPGQALNVGVKNLPQGSTPVLFWSLQSASIPFDGGTLLVADPTVVVLPTVGIFGQVGVGGDVPNDVALCGLAIHMQAMFVDPGASGSHQTAQTNGLKLVVGY